MAGVFITGTGTDVGKTTFSRVLYQYLQHDLGLNAAYMKPVQTGVGDKGFYCDYENVTKQKGTHLNTPYSFKHAVSPHLAAAMEPEAEDVSFDHIKYCYTQLCNTHDIVIVEGAGGACSPITNTELNIDLMKKLGIPIIVVVANRLGAIHDAIATINAIPLTQGVLGFVSSTLEPSILVPSEGGLHSTMLQNNIDTIEKFTNTTCLAQIHIQRSHNHNHNLDQNITVKHDQALKQAMTLILAEKG